MTPASRKRALVACLALAACLVGCVREDPAPIPDRGADARAIPDRGTAGRDLALDGAAADVHADAAAPADAAVLPDLCDDAPAAEDRGGDADAVAELDGLAVDTSDADAVAADLACGPYPHWNMHLGQCLPSCGRAMGDAALAKEGSEANYLAYGTCLMAHPADPCDPAAGHFLAQTWDCGTACCIYPEGDGGQGP